MNDSITRLAALSRPRLLIRAARAGQAAYDRARDLDRILRGPAPQDPCRALDALLEVEAGIEERRRAGDAAYDVGRHVELLVAIMAEAGHLPRPAAGVTPLATAAE